MARQPGLLLAMVALAGAAGSLLRWAVELRIRWEAPGGVPAGTLLVNATGSLLLGIVVGADLPDAMLAVAGAGLCGGLTTFSGITVQAAERPPRAGAVYLATSLALGLLAVSVGVLAGHAFR